MTERVSIQNGKYTFYTPYKDFRMHIDRYGEPWVVIEAGANAVYWLVAEVEELREKVADLEKKVSK